MTRVEYLNELRRALRALPAGEVDEILRDQEEYIRDAVAHGRREEDVLRGLGPAQQLAQSLVAESRIQQAASSSGLAPKAKHTLSAVLAILALAPFNLIFVLGPFLVALSMLMVGWTLGLTAVGLSVLFLLFYPFKLLLVSVGFWAHASAIFFLLGWLGAGVCASLIMAWVSHLFLKGTLSYLQWNLEFIRGRAA